MSAKQFNYLTATADQINKAIASIKQRGASLQSDIQDVGLAALVQIKAHGNTTPLNSLYKAIPEGARKAAFALWALRFGGVALEKGKAKKDNPFVLDDREAVDVEGAFALPWYKIKSEPSLDELIDPRGEFERLIKRLEAKAKRGQLKPGYDHVLDSVKAALGREETPAKAVKAVAQGVALPGGIQSALAAPLPAQV